MRLFRKNRESRLEAEGALRQTRREAERIKQKEAAARSLFQRIAAIRERNHIKEAVERIMEAR